MEKLVKEGNAFLVLKPLIAPVDCTASTANVRSACQERPTVKMVKFATSMDPALFIVPKLDLHPTSIPPKLFPTFLKIFKK